MENQDWFASASSNDIQYIRNNVTQFKTVRDVDGNTALMIAAGLKFCQIVDLLVSHEYGLKNSLGQTALMLAAIKGCSHCVSALASYESGQLTHQGKSALMMALFNGNVDAARILVPHELHIWNGDNSPESYLQQAIDKQSSPSLVELRDEILEIKSNQLWPFLNNIFKRLDNSEIMIYKSFQTTKKLDFEQKQNKLFETNMNPSINASVELPQLKPTPNTDSKQKQARSVYTQNLPTPQSIVQKKKELESNLDTIKSDLQKMQSKLVGLEKTVKTQQTGGGQLEFLVQRQSETDGVVNGIIKSIEELRMNLSQMMDYNSAFGKTVMNMLGQVVRKEGSGGNSVRSGGNE
ncbi:Ankyrin_repeat-containing protein [Hexamita inflata]|uniref:Ankyrin repeat-containing protein n=1 Tax=Hexamita inflata TaxID=28002 RepID=A0AA86Q4E5_9EUKA|nr:Ankyrin repeat-containing protein [Hexamita inflata]CAI9946100.1 Ankyrin repeat-containing protein [Hexamita inflata]